MKIILDFELKILVQKELAIFNEIFQALHVITEIVNNDEIKLI